MTVELSYAEYGAGPPLVILHGLFGSARNWTSLARHLGETHHVYALDLRNHGASGWAETMTYEEMAGDVRTFLASHGLEGAAVMGHSMGGKTAMRLALDDGSLIGRLIVVDIAPVAYSHTHGPMIAAMQGVDLAGATRRGEVDRQLEPHIAEAPLRSFLLQNLVAEDGRLRWRINLDALAANMAVLTTFNSSWPVRYRQEGTIVAARASQDKICRTRRIGILIDLPDRDGKVSLLQEETQNDIEPRGHEPAGQRYEVDLKRFETVDFNSALDQRQTGTEGDKPG